MTQCNAAPTRAGSCRSRASDYRSNAGDYGTSASADRSLSLRPPQSRYLMVALLILISSPVMKARAPAGPSPTPPDQHVIPTPSVQSVAQTLELQSPLEGELGDGKAPSYFINLQADQVAHITVEQRGIDVVLRLLSADGKLLARADDRSDTTGIEQILVLAESTAIYRLEIQAAEEADTGHYVVRLAELRAPTPQDRLTVRAERFFFGANQLLQGKTAESRRLAIKNYEEAETLFQQAGDVTRAASVIAQIGMVHGWMGDKQTAETYFNRALVLQREANNPTGEARALTGLGLLVAIGGEWQRALDYHQQALALRRVIGDRIGIMVSLDNIGVVYFELGEPQKALDYYNQALTILSDTNSLRLQAELLTHSGQVYEITGQQQKALEQYQLALALRLKRDNRGGAANALHRIGLLHASQGQLQTALERYEEALKIQQALGNIKAADTLTSIGEIYYRLGDAAKALTYFNRSSALRVETGGMPNEALTRYWVARVRNDQGDLKGALKEIEATVTIVENLRSKIATHELRASYFATIETYYEFYIDLLMQLHLRNPSSGYGEAALAASERARARSLLELLREARADIHRGVDPLMLERQGSLQRQLNEKAEQQSLLRTNKRTEIQATLIANELEKLTTEFSELEAQIRLKSPHYAALTQPRPLNLKEIQQLLDPETLLLEYKLGEKRSYLWAVTHSSIKTFELPKRSEVEETARQLYEALSERNREVNGEMTEQRQARLKRVELQSQTSARHLSQILLLPVASLLENNRLLIVGDGALHYIPFAALPAPETPEQVAPGLKPGNPSVPDRAGSEVRDSASGKLLIVDHEIVNLPSVTVLAALRQDIAGRKPAPKLIAVLADPVFDATDARVNVRVKTLPLLRKNNVAAHSNSTAATEAITSGSQAADVGQSGLDTGVIDSSNPIPRLPFSRREAAAILASATAGQGKVLLDFGASRATAMSGELSQYRYIHFATHGLLNSSHPELSGVVLSLVDEQGRPQNGFLRLNEIYNLELSADLVMLSACQTGLGKEIKGEGLVGLTRGFMYAGAARVAASLWKVDDAATAELMRRFYFGMLQKSLSPAAALRQAQVEMLGQKRWHSPYYWAAFTMQGEWR